MRRGQSPAVLSLGGQGDLGEGARRWAGKATRVSQASTWTWMLREGSEIDWEADAWAEGGFQAGVLGRGGGFGGGMGRPEETEKMVMEQA